MRNAPRRRVVLGVVVLLVLAAAIWRVARPAEAWSRTTGANVLLVTVDTLRADRFTATHMPQLAALARRGFSFPTTYAHAPLTLPSHASILTGLLPPAHGVRGNGAFRLGDAQVTLAERLKSAGFRTGAFVGAFVLDARFGLAQGFDTYRGVDDDRAFAADFAFAERRAEAVLGEAEAWVLQASTPDGPWFAWVHVFDPHAPYDAPGASPSAAYDGEVRHVDHALGGFLEHMRARGALDRTIVVLTADHGESLGEHGESTHGLFAYDATVRVPLVFAGPGIAAGTSAAPAAHIDLVPTILDTLGLPGDASLPGRSLRAGDPGARPIYIEAMEGWLAAGAAPVRGMVQAGLKLLNLPEPELYDLATDPAEVTNLQPDGDGRAQALRDALAQVDDLVNFAPGRSQDDATAARLRSLGYAAGAAGPPRRTFTAADDPKRVRHQYERFLSILGGGGRDPAALLELVAERPAFAAARLAAASLLIETGRAREAVGLLESAAAAPDATTALAERLGAAWLAAGEPGHAAEVLTPVVAAATASAEAWNAIGVARAQLGLHAEARSALDQAVTQTPSSSRFRFNRALIRLESGDRRGAIDDAGRVVALAPGFVDAWRLLATLHHDAGETDAAIAAWQRVVLLQPGDADSLFNLASTLAAVGRRADARAAAARYLGLSPPPGTARDTAVMRALVASQ